MDVICQKPYRILACGISQSSHVDWCSHSIEGHQTGQAQSSLSEAVLAVLDHVLGLNVP